MILVTGATGNLGRPTVELLANAGYEVRALSRQPGRDRVTADLSTGIGLSDALAGVTTVIHLASGANSHDSQQTRQLLRAIAAHPVDHLIFMSIVGVDRHALAFYRDKLLSEQLIASSGFPYTILRATQFHSFVARLLIAQRRFPVTIVPACRVQPVAIEEVAQRLVELVGVGPSQRVSDLAGPEQLRVRDIAEQWNSAHGLRRRVLSLPMLGAAGRSFTEGAHLSTLPGHGSVRFAEFAAAHADSASR